MAFRTQKHEGPAPRPHWDGWTDLVVETRDYTGHLASETKFATADKFGFLDITLEEYVGISRRAKRTSVRLEEPAARALLQLLTERFAKVTP